MDCNDGGCILRQGAWHSMQTVWRFAVVGEQQDVRLASKARQAQTGKQNGGCYRAHALGEGKITHPAGFAGNCILLEGEVTRGRVSFDLMKIGSYWSQVV